jgi:hypothetical protein
MNAFRFRQIFPPILLIASLCIAALLTACSTMPPPTPAYDVKSISGKWMGWADNQRYGRFLMTVVIRPEGSFTMTSNTRLFVSRVEFSGNLWVDQDTYQINCSTPELSGTMTLYSQKDSRWLAYRSTDGNTSANLHPVYK